MSGHIQRRGTRWQARYRGPDGRERAKRFDRKADAERWIATEKASLYEGRWIDPRSGLTTVEQHAAEWLALKHVKATTKAAYASHLRTHIVPKWGDRPISGIRPTELEAWLQELSEGLAPATVQAIWRTTAAVFRAAVRDRLIPSAPTDGIHPPSAPARLIIPLEPEEVGQILDASGRYRGLVALAAGSGLRQGELFGVTTTSLNMLRRELRVERQLQQVRSQPEWSTPKTAASVRTVPLADSTLKELARHLEQFRPGKDGVIFTSQSGDWLRRTSFSVTWTKILARADLDREAVRFHELRHFYASVLIQSGASVKAVQSRLGHASAAETLDTYAHIWPDEVEATRNAVDAVMQRATSA